MQASDLLSLADAPGTSREYETIYIIRANATNDSVAQINDRVRKVIEGMDGKVIQVDNWGKRRLAYEIKSERKGIYLYWQYLATHGVVEELERNLRMLDAVLRYLTVKRDSDVYPDARPSEVTDETYERAANTAADEEDMYLTRSDSDDEDDEDDEYSGARRDSGDSEAREASEASKDSEDSEGSEGSEDSKDSEDSEDEYSGDGDEDDESNEE